MESQIKELLSNEKLRQCYLTNRIVPGNINTGMISDITSGKLYNELVELHNFSNNDLFLTWNTDGIHIFKSSSYSIWPIQSVVNELPPHVREKNVLLHGLWFGNNNPAMNTFLTPFTDDCIQRETNEFMFEDEDHPRKVFAHVLSADSPA